MVWRVIFTVLLSALFLSCDDSPTTTDHDSVNEDLEYTVALGVNNNLPDINITSEDDDNVETLLCYRDWLDTNQTRIGCYLEKRLYENTGHLFRIAVDYTNFDDSGVLVGYAVDINGDAHRYGTTAASYPITCGNDTEIPVLDLDITIYPSSNISPLRACVDRSSVRMAVGDQTYYGCNFDGWAIDREFFFAYIPTGSQVAEGSIFSWEGSFSPDVPGDYAIGCELTAPEASDVDVIVVEAVVDPYLESWVNPTLNDYSQYICAPGMCWAWGSFWYFACYHNLIKTNSGGFFVAEYALPAALQNRSGIAFRSNSFWTICDSSGLVSDPYASCLCQIDTLGNLLSFVEIPSGFGVLAFDADTVWLGDINQPRLAKIDLSGNLLDEFTLTTSMGRLTDLAVISGELWISFSDVDERYQDLGGIGRFVKGEGRVEPYPFEFIHPSCLASDGLDMWCRDSNWGSLVKLNLP